MKKTLLSIGSLATIGAPIGAIVACAPENTKPKPPILPPFSENEDKTLLTLNYVDNINELSFSQARDLSDEIKRYSTISNIKFKNAANINIDQFKQDLKAYIDSDPKIYEGDLKNAFRGLAKLPNSLIPYLPSEILDSIKNKKPIINLDNFWDKLFNINFKTQKINGTYRLFREIRDIIGDIKYKNLKISNADDENGTLDISFDLTYKTGTLTFTKTFENFVKSSNKDRQDIKDLNYLQIPTSLTNKKAHDSWNDSFYSDPNTCQLDINTFQNKFGISLDLDNDPKFKGMTITDVHLYPNNSRGPDTEVIYKKNIKYGKNPVLKVKQGVKYVLGNTNGFAVIHVTFEKGSATETVMLYIIGWAK